MSADILEYVDQKVRDSASSSTEWSILYADDWAKLRAEIVRLRGEVDRLRRELCEAHGNVYIAPAEAKGDVPERCEECRHTTFEHRHDGTYICVHCKGITPQPADGGAVAYWVPNARAAGDGSWEDGPGSLVHAADASYYEKRIGTPLYTHPTGDALGAVLFGPNDVLRLWGCARVHDSVISDVALNSMRAVLTAALQHRGDSRGGEG